jgi:hypothetical protein
MKIKSLLIALGVGLGVTLNVMAASQDKYTLPDRYLVNEKAYLAEYPQLQKVMDVMIAETEKQLAKPQNDILHNRVCTVLVYQMAKDGKLSKDDTYLAVAGDLLHNITKNDKTRVLTDPKIVGGIDAVVKNCAPRVTSRIHRNSGPTLRFLPTLSSATTSVRCTT